MSLFIVFQESAVVAQCLSCVAAEPEDVDSILAMAVVFRWGKLLEAHVVLISAHI